MSLTLRDLRDQSGLSLAEVSARLLATGEPVPRFKSGVIHLEKRGTEKVPVIRALAKVYGRPFDVVAEAAENTRRAALSRARDAAGRHRAPSRPPERVPL